MFTITTHSQDKNPRRGVALVLDGEILIGVLPVDGIDFTDEAHANLVKSMQELADAYNKKL